MDYGVDRNVEMTADDDYIGKKTEDDNDCDIVMIDLILLRSPLPSPKLLWIMSWDEHLQIGDDLTLELIVQCVRTGVI